MNSQSEKLIDDVLSFKAPYLVEKLLKEKIVCTIGEAECLFDEVKKWLLLIHIDKTREWQMYSLRIDEVWHQFILYTNEYFNFCEKFFGKYVAHNPSNAPVPVDAIRTQIGNIKEFEECYQSIFKMSLPDLWFDERNVTILSRIQNDFVDDLVLNECDGLVILSDRLGRTIMSINSVAKGALAFMACTGVFFVREIPDLTDHEKIGLVAYFVERNYFRMAS